MKFPSSFTTLALSALLGWAGGVSSLQAQSQSPAPALASPEAFRSALQGVDWECSFTTYQRLRFGGETIELLAQDGKVTGTLKNVSLLEPGIIRVDYNSGGLALFIFSDDLKSFVIANMTDISEFEVPGAAAPVKLPGADTDPPVEIVFKDNPFWAKARLHPSRMEILDEKGSAFATNDGFAFYPHVLGVKLPEKRVGVTVMSRQRAGGWYLAGRHLGAGTPTKLTGVFRTSLRSRMTDFALRSAHFNRPLLQAGHEQTARAQEEYALYNAGNVYGEQSEQVIYAMNEMGRLRGYALSYDRAADWHGRAYTAAKTSLAQDPKKLLEIGTEYGDSLADRGDFDAAKTTLAEVLPHLPPSGDLRAVYSYYKAVGAAEFGLRNYKLAAQIFTENQKRAFEAKMEGSEVDAILDQAACFLALNEPLETAARVSLAAIRQDEITKQFPRYTFDTYKLSLAATTVQKWPEAQKYSAENQRRNSVTYMECARLLSLLCQGNKEAARKMAQDFTKRLGGLDDVQIRRDIDAMIFSVTKAAAEQTPQAVAELEQTWAQQVESLRKRPLQNYIFAKVMVTAIASLKSGG